LLLSEQQQTVLHLAARNGDASLCLMLIANGAHMNVVSADHRSPADVAHDEGYTELSNRLKYSGGVHRLRCTGPSLQRALMWNNTSVEEEESLLNEMQSQWLVSVVEGCGHTRVALALKQAMHGHIIHRTHLLVHILSFVFKATNHHLHSCLSTRPHISGVPVSLASHNLALSMSVASHNVQKPPRLHDLAFFRWQLSSTLSNIAPDTNDGTDMGCEWLEKYCDFLWARHRL
jgi:hypothetical protein